MINPIDLHIGDIVYLKAEQEDPPNYYPPFIKELKRMVVVVVSIGSITTMKSNDSDKIWSGDLEDLCAHCHILKISVKPVHVTTPKNRFTLIFED